MRSTILASMLVIFLTFPQPIRAGFRPSFILDSCAWDATHILRVSVTSEAAVFTVIESWKGDLQPGDRIKIPELRPTYDAIPVYRYPKQQTFDSTDAAGISGRIPKQPVGSQMVLFLKPIDAASRETREPTQRRWQAASFWQEMRVSVVRIHEHQIYCFQQRANPGPTALGRCWQKDLLDLAALTSRVRDVLRTQRNLSQVLRLNDSISRVDQLQTIVYGDVWYGARKEAIQSLGKTRPSALGAIERILEKPPVPYDSRDLIAAVGERRVKMLAKS